mmetsp:Transcript_28114/g.65710  ORF Transcript_28114/g.65710 Transcript_28114/m.65710 type:complete len:201 (+) Transcript_28114:118-720(+)
MMTSVLKCQALRGKSVHGQEQINDLQRVLTKDINAQLVYGVRCDANPLQETGRRKAANRQVLHVRCQFVQGQRVDRWRQHSQPTQESRAVHGGVFHKNLWTQRKCEVNLQPLGGLKEGGFLRILRADGGIHERHLVLQTHLLCQVSSPQGQNLLVWFRVDEMDALAGKKRGYSTGSEQVALIPRTWCYMHEDVAGADTTP